MTEHKNNVSDELLDCVQLKRLKNNLNHCQNTTIVSDNIVSILNDFLFLLPFSTNDDNFQYIYEYLGGYCSIPECEIFKRNYRNRTKSRHNPYEHTQRQPLLQIIDKIHCFYCHAYDIGNKLCPEDKSRIYNIKNNQHHWKRPHLNAIKKILQNKHSTIKIDKYLNNTMNKRYNQLCVDHKAVSNSIYDKVYNIGFRFRYGYNDKQVVHNMNPDLITILPKYSSLKDELISNDIITISIDQFCNEYKKAEIHFRCNYSRAKFKSLLLVENILSVMIYCNY
eukprot:231389_1